ncbi:MAG: carboxymuconolactone decarboxylase family protein [Vicinamibacterales bacterium]
MTRQTPIEWAKANPQQQDEYVRLTLNRQLRADGFFGGPVDAWLMNGELSHRLRALGDLIWERTSLKRAWVEFAIVITATFWKSNFEWWDHADRAVQYGMAQADVDDVTAGRRPSGSPEAELIYEVCMAMHAEHRLSHTLYQHAVEVLGERGLMELMATIGYYTLVSMTLNAFEIQPRPGLVGPFER